VSGVVGRVDALDRGRPSDYSQSRNDPEVTISTLPTETVAEDRPRPCSLSLSLPLILPLPLSLLLNLSLPLAGAGTRAQEKPTASVPSGTERGTGTETGWGNHTKLQPKSLPAHRRV